MELGRFGESEGYSELTVPIEESSGMTHLFISQLSHHTLHNAV